MVIVEILENLNCAAVDARVFHDLETPRRVSQVRLARQEGAVCWHDVTGWTTAGTPCPAMIQKVDDSGEGVAFLIYGGDAGLRLRPSEQTTPWQLGEPHQWGEPYLLVGDMSDVHIAQQSKPVVARGKESD